MQQGIDISVWQKPASTGFKTSIISPSFSLGGPWPASVASTYQSGDLTKGIGGYWSGREGTLTIPYLPNYPLLFQFVAIY